MPRGSGRPRPSSCASPPSRTCPCGARTSSAAAGRSSPGGWRTTWSGSAAGTPVAVHEAPYATSFIHHRELADFLHWTAEQSFTGPVNAASHGAPDVVALCEAVAGQVGRRPRYRLVGQGEAASPFSFDRAYAMDNGRAAALGFGFGRVADWLPGAIAETRRAV